MDIRIHTGNVDTATTKDGVTTIAFYHPAQNSLPGYLLDVLARLIERAGNDDATKIIVLKSAGNSTFCAGASFDELLQIKTNVEGKAFFSGFAKVINACRKCPKIIIGRVQGKAIGGGVGIAAAADICYATEDASIKLSELSIGIGPFVIEPVVRRKMGLSAFSQLALNASEFYTAYWANQNGLYGDVFETPVEMDSAIVNLTRKMVNWSPEALSEFKKALWEGTEHWDTLLTDRAGISGRLILTPFAQEAISKFIVKK